MAAELAKAELTTIILKNEFSARVTWVKRNRKILMKNVQESLEILRRDSVEHIYLGTDFLHILRAQPVFEKYISMQDVKIERIPVPSSYFEPERYSISDLLPQSITRLRRVVKEIISDLIY